ncbi:MAG TPA: ferric reductase, partial [Rhodocyclaceae bacterium]|nr:ferric reductase [Rhodocyclaceae bacterium]
MKTMFASLFALVAGVWGWDVFSTSFAADAHPLWIARQEALYLSGLLSIALMSLAMLLATRP